MSKYRDPTETTYRIVKDLIQKYPGIQYDLQLIHNDQTLFKVLDALISVGLTDQKAQEAIISMQNFGIVFRELSSENAAKDEVYRVLEERRNPGWGSRSD